jgi:hypothetical protein
VIHVDSEKNSFAYFFQPHLEFTCNFLYDAEVQKLKTENQCAY